MDRAGIKSGGRVLRHGRGQAFPVFAGPGARERLVKIAVLTESLLFACGVLAAIALIVLGLDAVWRAL